MWDKGLNARPQRGRFRAQAEYLVWGSKDPMVERDVYLPEDPGHAATARERLAATK